MIRKCLFATGFHLMMIGSGLAQTDDLKSAIDQLQRALQAEEAPKDPRKLEIRERSRMLLDQLPDTIASGNSVNVESVIQQLAAMSDSEAIRTQCMQIATALREKRRAAEKKKLEEIDAALKAAGESVRAANKPEELDSSLSALSALQGERSFSDNSIAFENRRQQVEAGLQFLRRWQDYLANKSVGDWADARQALNNLTQEERYSLNWVPRSEILKRIQEVQPDERPRDSSPQILDQVTAILNRLKTPEELPAAIVDLRKVIDSNRNNSSGDFESVVHALNSLDQSYRDFQAGLGTQIELMAPRADSSTNIPNPVPAIRAQILLLVLPRYLGLPADQKPKPGEFSTAFLKRIQTEAASRGDYLLAAKAADTESILREGFRSQPNNSQAGLFVIGQNQEAAGQISLAIASYEKALTIPVQIVPPQVIGARIAELSKKYPEDFQKGIDLYLAPPFMDPMTRDAMMRETAMRAQMMGSRPPQPWNPMQQPPPSPPTPVLTIPAASSRPVSTPQPKPSATPAPKTP